MLLSSDSFEKGFVWFFQFFLSFFLTFFLKGNGHSEEIIDFKKRETWVISDKLFRKILVSSNMKFILSEINTVDPSREKGFRTSA